MSYYKNNDIAPVSTLTLYDAIWLKRSKDSYIIYECLIDI